MTDRVRVRFAPSPTGYLHVGGARTALFNWLFARHHGGTFVLRIEDTDVERSSDEMVAGILGGLRWLGIDWDEGPEVGGPHAPYFQSGRRDRYRTMAERLVAEGHGYYCYCAPDTLKARRAEAEARGEAYSYDRTCLALSAADIAARETAGTPRAIRVRVPEGRTSFKDLVRGTIEIDHAVIEDFVVLRSDGHPTYHLSVVVDDVDMAITHVVRGDATPGQGDLSRINAEPPPTNPARKQAHRNAPRRFSAGGDRLTACGGCHGGTPSLATGLIGGRLAYPVQRGSEAVRPSGDMGIKATRQAAVCRPLRHYTTTLAFLIQESGGTRTIRRVQYRRKTSRRARAS